MFLRKLCVMVLPLVMAALLCLVLPMMEGMPFWTDALVGLLLGVCLALLLPLSGASKRREPFAVLLWVPAVILLVVVIVQYLETRGISVPVLGMLRTTQGPVVMVECAFIGYMLTAFIRTRK